jgi:NAD(P)H-dependent flavin oxidoreductase YrpB (nitropropane dioxygenase family)
MLPEPALSAIFDAVDEGTTAPFGVNFLMPFVDPAVVEMAASRARVVDFFYDEPSADLVELVHQGGALAGWQVGSGDEAAAAADAGCDLVVAQGVEAGGHVRGTVELLPLLAEVLDRVDVPVVAAGGITTRTAVEEALASGADAVRVGTRFIASPEADAHPDYVGAVLAADGGDTELTETFSVMWPDAPHRVLRSCIGAAQASEAEIVGEVEIAGEMTPVPRLAVIPPGRTATGDLAAMCLYAGAGVGEVTEVKPAAEIVAELTGQGT